MPGAGGISSSRSTGSELSRAFAARAKELVQGRPHHGHMDFSWIEAADAQDAEVIARRFAFQLREAQFVYRRIAAGHTRARRHEEDVALPHIDSLPIAQCRRQCEGGRTPGFATTSEGVHRPRQNEERVEPAAHRGDRAASRAVAGGATILADLYEARIATENSSRSLAESSVFFSEWAKAHSQFDLNLEARRLERMLLDGPREFGRFCNDYRSISSRDRHGRRSAGARCLRISCGGGELQPVHPRAKRGRSEARGDLRCALVGARERVPAAGKICRSLTRSARAFRDTATFPNAMRASRRTCAGSAGQRAPSRHRLACEARAGRGKPFAGLASLRGRRAPRNGASLSSIPMLSYIPVSQVVAIPDGAAGILAGVREMERRHREFARNALLDEAAPKRARRTALLLLSSMTSWQPSRRSRDEVRLPANRSRTAGTTQTIYREAARRLASASLLRPSP